MATKYILASVIGASAIAYVSDYLIADKKIFGGNYRGLSQFLRCATIALLSQFFFNNFLFRINPVYCFEQGVVGRNRQEIPSMASYCRSTCGHEPHQSPEFHRQDSL